MIGDLTGLVTPDATGVFEIPDEFFLLVSTLTTGSCLRAKCSRVRQIWRNCRSRSVRLLSEPLPLRAILLRLAWREYPSSLSRQPTHLSLTRIPSRLSSSAIFRVALRVHFSPVIGSPAVSYFIRERMRSII